ncbi:Suppressor of fused [Nymphon striatum]|nr:Suppressor of fused [Nymphon striatum]
MQQDSDSENASDYCPISLTPLGLDALYSVCKKVYPDQQNPLQVTAKTKYWLGGPDPLDYISMYSNPGDADQGIPPHWHYVSFGLSDLHGDGRVHESSGLDTPSGFGFELTFRLQKCPDETMPPTWPAPVMQALAKYVFKSDNALVAGDHVSWHHSLDNSESRLQHILLMEDPQLGTVNTPFGPVNFVQIVGICTEELQVVQQWNGPGIINLMKSVRGIGGPWLVTNMRRGETILEIDPHLQEAVDEGINTDGSNLTCVSARCSWIDTDVNIHRLESGDGKNIVHPKMTEQECNEIKSTLKKGLLNTNPVLPSIKSIEDEEEFQKESYDSNASGEAVVDTGEMLPIRSFETIHIQLNSEAGLMLPLALKGRLRHGRHFTFKSVLGDVAITLVTPSVSGTVVSYECPYTSRGPWLQVLIEEDFLETMLEDLEILNSLKSISLPRTFNWPNKKLMITITPEFF